MFDPFLCLARVFSSWASLRLLMIGILCWLIILLGLSGFTAENAAADITLIKWKGTTNYNSFTTQICGATPYSYLSPFAFTFQQANSTTKATVVKSVAKTKCAFPSQNQSLRFTICVFSLLAVVALFFKTRFSSLARAVSSTFALLFFASFVLDATASTTGLAECNAQFVNTAFNVDLVKAGVLLYCDASDYSGLVGPSPHLALPLPLSPQSLIAYSLSQTPPSYDRSSSTSSSRPCFSSFTRPGACVRTSTARARTRRICKPRTLTFRLSDVNVVWLFLVGVYVCGCVRVFVFVCVCLCAEKKRLPTNLLPLKSHISHVQVN